VAAPGPDVSVVPGTLTDLIAARTPCPHCRDRPIVAGRAAWFVQSYVFFTRYGTKIEIGCRECVGIRVRKHLLTSALAGWWGFPGGLATPFVIIQNIFVLQQDEAKDLATLEKLLDEASKYRMTTAG
jgi:hypothetical protein